MKMGEREKLSNHLKHGKRFSLIYAIACGVGVVSNLAFSLANTFVDNPQKLVPYLGLNLLYSMGLLGIMAGKNVNWFVHYNSRLEELEEGRD